MKNLNKNIKEWRLKKGYTLSEIAGKIGVTEATFQRYESGLIKNIKYEHILKMAEIYGITPQILMGWNDKEKTEEPPKREKIIMEGFEDTSDQMVIKKLKTYKFFSSGVGSVDLNSYEEVEFMLPEKIYKDISENGYNFKIYDKNMEPFFLEGDTIAFTYKKWEAWEEFNRKLLLLNIDGKTFIKKLFFHEGIPYFHTFNEEVYPKVKLSNFKKVELIAVLRYRIQDLENYGF